MPITRSAKKALRNATRRRVFNIRRKTVMKRAVKQVRTLVAAKETTDAGMALRTAYQAIDKAAKRGIIKRNAAARKKSRLAHALNKAAS